MKKTVYILLMMLGCLSNTLNAQQKAIDAIKNSPFILDGTTCGMKFLKNINGKDYISYPIIVHKILKGNKSIHQGDTIELISEMPSDWGFIEDTLVYTPTSTKPVSWINGIKLGVKARGIYFLKKEIFQNKPVFGLYLNQNNGYFGIKNIYKTDENNMSISEKVIYGFSTEFNSFDSFNIFLKNNGLEEIKENPLEYIKKKVDALPLNEQKENKHSISVIQEQRKANYNHAVNFILDKRNNTDTTFHGKTMDIDIEIKNQAVIYNSTENSDFYEFDIFVKGNSSSTYIDNLAFVIGYNTSAFNTNIVNSQGVSIAPATGFDTPTYDDPMSGVSDEPLGDSFRFRVGTSLTANSWNRVKLTTVPQKLVHVKMKIVSCNNYNSNTQFLDINGVSIVDVYANSATINPMVLGYLAYNANYIQPASFQLCSSLQIIDFTPKIISSGTESVITIIGQGFGTHRGNTQVIFKASKDGGSSDVPYLNSYDYLNGSWSDTIIKIVIPYSVKDSISTDEYPLGSGQIRIKKGTQQKVSDSTLYIKYANDSYTATSSSNPANVLSKIPFRQVTFSGSPYNYTNGHSREFYLDTSVSNNPTMKAIIEKSLRDWSCETGINWAIVGTTENHGYVEDGKSVIFLDNALVGDTLGYTKPIGISACYDNSSGESKRFMFAKEIDMGFARVPRNKSWALDTIMTNGIPNNKYDFYEIVMHELGHAHYLGHINKSSDIMFYGSTYGPISATNRRHIFTSANSIEGGNYIIDRSLAILLDGCQNINISTAYHPSYCGTMSAQDIENELFDINVYPNPFNSTVTLIFSNSEILNTNQLDYTITDISGKIIMKSEFKTGSDYKINLSNLNSGIYLLNITNGSNLKRTMKLIKQ